MKAQIIYTPSNESSGKIGFESQSSFKSKKGWDVSLVEGIVREDFDDLVLGNKLRNDFDVKFAKNGRLWMMKNGNDTVWKTKQACVFNHLYFWKKVIESNETQCFIEHDIICVADAEEYEFEDYLILNMGDAFTNKKYPVQKGIRNYPVPMTNKYNNLLDDKSYPLVYNKPNKWENAYMVPGTAAYAITPAGAKKMLDAALSTGIDQSDFILNTKNCTVEYINPSPVVFNTQYVTTSWGL
jgi:GR25 family glycosyltransferase involved in LPS biosynthesis